MLAQVAGTTINGYIKKALEKLFKLVLSSLSKGNIVFLGLAMLL